MPPKKFAHSFSLSIPPFLITFSKDLVVFWTPRRALIERSIQRLLESANLSPQLRSFEAWLVLQNSFDRIVRTGSATLHPFAQNSIDLFRGEKPEQYGEWVLLGTKQGLGGPPLAVDEELLTAARAAWPRVLAHVRSELFDKERGPERTATAADIWDRVLQSVAKTRQRNKDHGPPVSDLESYLIAVFHHRLNRVPRQEQRRAETIELVS